MVSPVLEGQCGTKLFHWQPNKGRFVLAISWTLVGSISSPTAE